MIGCRRDGDRFSATAEPAAMPTFGEPLPLPDGPWDVLAPVRRRAGDAGRLRPRPAGRHLAQEGRGRAEAVRVHHRRVRLAGDHRRAAAAAVGAGQLQPAGAAPGALPDPVAAPAAGRGPVRELERQAVHGQPPRDRRGAAPPRGRPRAHLGGDRLRGRGPRRRPGGAVRDRGVLRRARPLPVRDLQRRHAAVLPQAGGPGLPADLARDPAEEDRLRHRPPAVRQRHRLLRPPGRRHRQVGPAAVAEPVQHPDLPACVPVRG